MCSTSGIGSLETEKFTAWNPRLQYKDVLIQGENIVVLFYICLLLFFLAIIWYFTVCVFSTNWMLFILQIECCLYILSLEVFQNHTSFMVPKSNNLQIINRLYYLFFRSKWHSESFRINLSICGWGRMEWC